jgi:hypothetical protein
MRLVDCSVLDGRGSPPPTRPRAPLDTRTLDTRTPVTLAAQQCAPRTLFVSYSTPNGKTGTARSDAVYLISTGKGVQATYILPNTIDKLLELELLNTQAFRIRLERLRGEDIYKIACETFATHRKARFTPLTIVTTP